MGNDDITVNGDRIQRRNELFEALRTELVGTIAEVRPRSVAKYNRDEETAIIIRIDSLRPEKTTVCGVEVQERRGPYKVWFDTHPEWEKRTNYPVKDWASNGTGRGSGSGFYIETKDACVYEIVQYLKAYYI